MKKKRGHTISFDPQFLHLLLHVLETLLQLQQVQLKLLLLKLVHYFLLLSQLLRFELFTTFLHEKINSKVHIFTNFGLFKLYFWGPLWSYQLNSTANSDHLAHFRGKWAGLAVMFSWQLQNGPQDFDFFNCHRCRLFI